MIHRDVSPHNCLISWDASIKVSDFGIAKVRASTQAAGSQHLKGKPAFMAPEQMSAKPIDGRADLWAVGVILYQMLVGENPFQLRELGAILWRVLSYDPPPHLARPGVPEDISAVTMGLLQKNPEARYARAGDVVAALLACRDAPRDGRGELVRLLTERFPGRARPSGAYAVAMGSSMQGLTPPPMAAAATPAPVPPLAPTVSVPPQSAGAAPPWAAPALAAAPPWAAPPLEVPYGSQMPTVPPPVRRRRWPLMVALGSITAAVLVTAVIVGREGGASSEAGAGMPPTPKTDPVSTAAVPTVTAPDAGVAPAPEPVDAGVPAVTTGPGGEHNPGRPRPPGRPRYRDAGVGIQNFNLGDTK